MYEDGSINRVIVEEGYTDRTVEELETVLRAVSEDEQGEWREV